MTEELDFARLGGTPPPRVPASFPYPTNPRCWIWFGLTKPTTVCQIVHRVVLALSRQLQMSARLVEYCTRTMS